MDSEKHAASAVDSGQPDDLGKTNRADTHERTDYAKTDSKLPYFDLNFIGSFLAAVLSASAAFNGFLMPATSLPLIEQALEPSPNVFWIALAWVLASAVSFILLGRLSDLFGRRWFYVGCAFLGLIGAIIGATAQHINTLIGASVLLGLASAGQLTFTVSIGELVPITHRFVTNGIILLSVLPFSGLGPYLARLLIVQTPVGFRGIYYLAIALNGAAFLLWLTFYHPPSFAGLHRDRTLSEELADQDYGGILLYISGFFLFLLGLDWGGSVYPWASATVLAPLIIGFFVLVAFVLYEIFMPLRRPLIPMHLFKDKDFAIINILSAVVGIVYYAANTLFPYMIAGLYTTDIVEAGLISSCIGGGVCAGNFIGCFTAVPGGHIRAKLIIITCCLAAFTAGLAGATMSEATGQALAVCSGFTVGMLEVIIATMVTIVIEDQADIGIAGGIFGSVRAAAGVLATAIYVSVFLNKKNYYTTTEVIPALTSAVLPPTSVQPFLSAVSSGSMSMAEMVPGVTPAIIQAGMGALTDAYAQTFRIVWLATLAFGLLAVIASLFTSDIDDKLSKDVFRRLGGRGQESTGDVENKNYDAAKTGTPGTGSA